MKSKPKVQNFKISFSSIAIPARFAKVDPRPIIKNPEAIQSKIKPQPLMLLEMCSYHIFTNDIGRSQVEPPSIDE